MEWSLAILVGLALSAACGFRVFVPPLVISIAAQAGHLELAEGFDWLASPVATVAFGVATVIEIGGYIFPWLDNLLDTLSVPAAAVAGTVLTAAMVTDVSPFLQWSLAAVAGGGLAGSIAAGMAIVRGQSSMTTLGMANPGVSLIEAIVSGTVSVLAAFVPLIAAGIAAVISLTVVVALLRRRSRRKGQATRACAHRDRLKADMTDPSSTSGLGEGLPASLPKSGLGHPFHVV